MPIEETEAQVCRRSAAVVLVATLSLGWAAAEEADLPGGFERLVAPEGQAVLFGYSVAVDGDRVVIGAPYSPVGKAPMGAVFVFERHGIGWSVDHLTAEDSWTGSRAWLAKRQRRFGYSVDLAGDRIVVGAPGDSVTGEESGSVFVFDLVDGEWVWTRLTHDEVDPKDGVGYRVQISGDGDRILAGSLAQGGYDFRGKAFLFEWDGEQWGGTLFEAGDGQKPDQFGSSIGLGEGFVVMGSPWHDGRRGAVYVYDEQDDGEWVETKIDPPGPVPGGYFGAGLSVYGETILIGSADPDSVFELRREDGDWAMEGFDISAADADEEEPGAGFEPGGAWSPFGGDLLYVADFGTGGPNRDPGAVRILQEQEGGWSEIDRYEGTDFGEGEAFGWDLAIDGEVLTITAPLHEVDGETTGAAYVQGMPWRCGTHRPTILGTRGDDEIFGTPGDDVILPGTGSDVIHGSGGKDVYCLEAGGEYTWVGSIGGTRTGREGREILVTTPWAARWWGQTPG